MDVNEGEIEALHQELVENLPENASWANSFFNGAGKYSALLTGEQAFILDRRVKRYTASTPVWVRYISFATDDAATLKQQLTCTAYTIDGKAIEKKLSTDDAGTFAFVWFSSLITSFDIKSDGVINKPSLKKISINGFDLNTFEKVASKVDEALEIKGRIDSVLTGAKQELAGIIQNAASAEERLADLEAKCDSVEDILDAFNQQKQMLESEVAELANTATVLSSKNEQATTALESVKNNVQQLSEQSKELNEKIRREKTLLESITNDRSLISDEYKDYVKEGKAQNLLYFALSILPMAVIIIAANKIFSGAEALLFKNYESFTDVFAGLLLRLPFSIVLGLGMFYSWKLTANLFGNAFKIHKDRLVLARLLVIAKDTVFSSAQGLDVSDEVKFNERIRLKIELLKSHLSKELAADFNYGKPLDVGSLEKTEQNTDDPEMENQKD